MPILDLSGLACFHIREIYLAKAGNELCEQSTLSLPDWPDSYSCLAPKVREIASVHLLDCS